MYKYVRQSRYTTAGLLTLPLNPKSPFTIPNKPQPSRKISTFFSPKMSLPQTTSSPPIAKKVKHEMEMFGDVRVDNYYWLRDDSRSDPDVLSYLNQENAYTESVMSGICNTFRISIN